MLAVEVHFLTGRYCATRHNDRSQPEWPPHPHRLFSAMVAAWADADDPDPAERAALEWFEALGAPQLACSGATARSETFAYVPVNDASVAQRLDRLYERHEPAKSSLNEARSRGDAKAAARAERQLAKILAEVGARSSRATAAKADESAAATESGLQVLPERRGRQARQFPTAIPDEPIMCFIWPDAAGEPRVVDRIDRLLARVHRLGHSSTLVACRVTPQRPEANLMPDPSGAATLRVTGPGLLADLDRAHARHGGNEPRTLPSFHAPYGLRRVLRDEPASVLSGGWIVLERVDGPMLPIRRTAELACNVRRALLSHATDPPPELITGHAATSTAKAPGAPSQRCHLAVLPLPFVGHPHADSAIHGVALAVLAGTGADERAALQASLSAWAESPDGALPVQLGRAGVMRLALRAGPLDRAILRRSYWCRAADSWATATPIALDRHPGSLRDRSGKRREKAELEAEASIRLACVVPRLR